MELLRDNEEKVMCPYNSAHYIRKSRVDVHLKKCRLSCKESINFVTCDFNASHRIPEQELQYHHDLCPNRRVVEMHIYGEQNVATIGANVRAAIPVPVDDSWDDVDVPTYNPQKYCEENHILRRIDTESAATRRDFRIAERHRINNLGPKKTGTILKADPSTNGQEIKTRDTPKNLPPTKAFTHALNIESTPKNITEMMASLAMTPKAVIPKTK